MVDDQIMFVPLMLVIIIILILVFILMTDVMDRVENSCTKDEDNEFSGAIQREIDILKIQPVTARSYYALVILEGIKQKLLLSIIDEYGRRFSQPAYMANVPYWRIEQMYLWDYEMMMERYDKKFQE